jgi:pimeloyl-ACP methyl ester carboxylesterase
MTTWQIILIVAASLAAVCAVTAVLIRIGSLRVREGDEARGLAILCGGLRWFGGRWGLRCVPVGLSKGGFEGKCIYWPWHGRCGPGLNLSDIWNTDQHERHAREIADYIVQYKQQHPAAPVYVLGCSAGGQVALRAIELLPDGVSVTAATLLSAAVSPRRDVTGVLAHLDGPLINSCSLLDFAILGLGTRIVGTGDRKRSASAGMVGLRSRDPRVVNVSWRPSMIFTGRMGGHNSCMAPAYIARYLTPLMGIAGV